MKTRLLQILLLLCPIFFISHGINAQTSFGKAENINESWLFQLKDEGDAFKPDFNITEFLNLCHERDVKYIILYDFGIHEPFFNTTLDYVQVLSLISATGKFGDPSDQPFWGEYYGWYGYRIFLVRFLG